MAGSMLPGCQSPQVGRGSAASVPGAYQRFGVDDDVIRRTLSEAMSRGGDFGELYFQQRLSQSLNLEDHAVKQAGSEGLFGVGVRVVKGMQSGYSFTEEITPEALRRAAQTAAAIAEGSGPVVIAPLAARSFGNYYPITTDWRDVSCERKIPWLERLDQSIFARDRRIIKATISCGTATSHILIARSDGRVIADSQPGIRVFVNCTAEQDGRREQNMAWLSARRGPEFFNEENFEYLSRTAVERTVGLFEAIKPQAGTMPLVLAPGQSGILLHEAIGHGLEGDFNRKNISIFSDKLGQRIAPEFVTIYDDGTQPYDWGSANVDDEGNPTEKTVLVENGILRSYMHDEISARYFKVSPTGNGRRENFRCLPYPRMRSTCMAPGTHHPQEIIASVDKGLYAEVFTNGQVDIGAGDFTFYVKVGYLIEGGKLTRQVKDINVIGSGPAALSNITMVGNDTAVSISGGMCGKEGQSIPVTSGLPTTKIAEITVGGV